MGISDTPKQLAHTDTNGIASSSLLWFNRWNRKVMDMANCEQGLKIFTLLKVFWFNSYSQLVRIYRDLEFKKVDRTRPI